MYLLDWSFDSPKENLACDEALLEACEAGELEGEVLRFWESSKYFVVLGYTGKVAQEADVATCKTLDFPILRRSSGGGTVLQGPGCLNYSLILKIEGFEVSGITQTNCYVMRRNARALTKVLNTPVEVRGYSDLAIVNKKFSGNAQRRKQKYLLFHGTLLLDFDLSLIEKVLLLPPKQPEYRAQRSHLDFLMNLNVPADCIENALREEWQANEVLGALPQERMLQLINEKYARDEWNYRFT